MERGITWQMEPWQMEPGQMEPGVFRPRGNLQIAMDDPALVRGFEHERDLRRRALRAQSLRASAHPSSRDAQTFLDAALQDLLNE
jgi:hypothetical protein